mmetsp:Transcript_22439/g.57485  ORF Transcript_22439/g.57485 Transcript_22439/m.57485 type:complete len:237 (+) Transcript_22439:217-927(+)
MREESKRSRAAAYRRVAASLPHLGHHAHELLCQVGRVIAVGLDHGLQMPLRLVHLRLGGLVAGAAVGHQRVQAGDGVGLDSILVATATLAAPPAPAPATAAAAAALGLRGGDGGGHGVQERRHWAGLCLPPHVGLRHPLHLRLEDGLLVDPDGVHHHHGLALLGGRLPPALIVLLEACAAALLKAVKVLHGLKARALLAEALQGAIRHQHLRRGKVVAADLVADVVQLEGGKVLLA